MIFPFDSTSTYGFSGEAGPSTASPPACPSPVRAVCVINSAPPQYSLPRPFRHMVVEWLARVKHYWPECFASVSKDRSFLEVRSSRHLPRSYPCAKPGARVGPCVVTFRTADGRIFSRACSLWSRYFRYARRLFPVRPHVILGTPRVPMFW